jgi:hypothetical protein
MCLLSKKEHWREEGKGTEEANPYDDKRKKIKYYESINNSSRVFALLFAEEYPEVLLRKH